MGKFNRDANNQKTLSEQQSQILGLKSKLDAAESELRELRAAAKPLEEIETQIAEKQKALDALIEEIGVAEDAKSIVARSKSIISDAEKKAQEIRSAADGELVAVRSEIEKADKDLEEIKQLLDLYVDADDIISSAQAKAAKIVSDTEKEMQDARAAAREQAASTIAEAQQALRDAQAQATEILRNYTERGEQRIADAQTQAKEMIDKARSDAQYYYDNKETEGNARRDRIIEAAERERDRISETARRDAQTEADGIRNSAKKYSESTRTAADSYASSVRTEADAARQKIADSEKAILAAAHQKADEIKNAALEEINAERERLRAESERLALAQAEIDSARRRNEWKEKELAQRENDINDEVAARVQEEHATLKHALDSAQETVNATNRENQKLQKKLADNRAATIQGVEQYEELLRELEKNGLSFDVRDIIKSFTDYKVLNDNYDKLLQEYRKFNGICHNQERNIADNDNLNRQLKSAEQQSEYFEGVAKKLLDDAAKNKKVTREEMVRSIRVAPECIVKNAERDPDIGEKEWLDDIKVKSENSGLYFSERQLYAFHTAQKIRSISPLVVLAGISGTGKSELPKNYALNGGMHFVSVPVKPDWDSPMSLFGYFNSVERCCEPTELLRALWQMSNNPDCKDQMLMVLLDEMNLAHPEQYFADILSNLETSRGYKSIPYKMLLGGGEDPEPIEIGSNVLWTGTMNEDETTKGLSDKVVDRSTLITFPRPDTLRSRGKNAKEQVQCDLLSRSTWDKWVKASRYGDESELIEKKIVEYRNAVQEINREMSHMSRNLGHRVWQGIEAYIRNYPTVITAKTDDDLVKAMAVAFADAVAFKIMPKLRGVEVRGQNEAHLDAIGKTIAANADELSGDYQTARSMTTDLFQWSSAVFMNDSDNGSK